jgi:hypothetical protein
LQNKVLQRVQALPVLSGVQGVYRNRSG